jgi:predicted transcriptional regulator
MATITINVPESLVNRLQRIPEAELSLLLQEIVEEFESENDSFESLSQEDPDAIGAGLAEEDAGYLLDGHTVLAELRQQVGLK